MTSTVLRNIIRRVPRITGHNLRQCSSASRHTQEESSGQKTTHFGYETVLEGEKAEKVHRVFENVANKYDLMNDLMSGGIHRVWKDVFMSRLQPTPTTKLLDVAGGTGDIVFRFIQHVDQVSGGGSNTVPNDTSQDSNHTLQYNITVCDISESMLKVGQQRAEAKGYQGIHWVCGNAQDLPFEDDLFDCYTIAFGIRNVVDVEKALSEAYRVLKPGGRFMCLEFSQVKNSSLRWVYDQYSFNIIPPLGQVIAGDWKSYQYLVESIRKFPDQESFKEMIEATGFRNVKYENLTFGVVAIHSGFKI